MERTYDFIAVGVGPFNLGLACLTAPIETLDGVFLDKSEQFNWHPGMLLQDTTLQIPFMADLVTLADPTSPFSFLSYLKAKGRIYSFYIRENFLVLRNEYNHYCRWVIEQLPNIHFNTSVEKIEFEEDTGIYHVHCLCTKTDQAKTYRAKRLVLGTGTVPYVPACCVDIMDKAIHSASYLFEKEALQSKRSITILGSGQSAAEVYYDLLQDIDRYNYELSWITRSPRFFPLEYSKLTLEMTSPGYIDYFYSLPQQEKDHLLSQQKHLYKGINNDLVAAIYDLLYTKSLSSDIKVHLFTNSELQQATFNGPGNSFDLLFRQKEQNRSYRRATEALVLATGYAYQLPGFVQGISSRIKWDEKGRFDVNRNYSIDHKGCEIFVQNAELHTHGFTAPDLGMGCYRNAYIIKEMTGENHYPVEQKITFQQFGIAGDEQVHKVTPELAV